MKNFRDYINEEMMPYAQSEKGFVGVDNGPVRDNINLLLATVTERPHATPYHALEVVRKVLAPFHIHPPATNFLDGNEGHEIFQINQFGEKMGMTNSGDVVTKDSSPYFLYFEYSMNSRGSFDIFSEIVNQEELDEILDDVEDEIESDVTTGDGRDAEDSFDVYRAGNKGREEIRESEEKTMPSWYAKQPGAAHREALKKEKKKEQDKKIKYAIRRLKEASDDEWNKTLAARNQNAASAAGNLMAPAKGTIQKQVGSINEPRTKADYGGDINLAKKDASRFDRLNKFASQPDNVAKKPVTTQDRATASQFEEETQLDEKLSPEQKRKIRRRLGPNTPENRMRQNSDSAREEIRLAKRGGKDKDLNEATEKRKELLKKYIKAASHDVAARSAAVRGFARDADDQRKSGQAMDARRSDARADKMFKKSWNRRKYMAKAVDKLTTEAKDSYAAYQRRMGMNPEKAAKKEGEWSKKIKKQEKEAAKKSNKLTTEAQSADTHTGALTYKGKPVVSPTATSVQPTFPPKNVPVPKPRPANLEESNPAREGAIAAGYKGSNPAEQGSIAVKKDDENRANFKVAKKLARKATKEIIKKKKS